MTAEPPQQLQRVEPKARLRSDNAQVTYFG